MSGKYIVVFKKTATPEQIRKYADDVTANGGQVKDLWENRPLLKGFSAEIPNNFVAHLQSLQGDLIDYIEPDSTVTIQSS
ncbi:uncharacterized protein PHACADRAFT_257985 [Phanerochaete carnosa HHB-10118-sp]|uniref:Inhibitor I9 domain-containing protein n=1 Tax=Phanerochaete carnosa (strain HHB-10118-sp) TaxID=650164 RepID=K5W5M8_PHACS|nr:uncharacterized protein PHACADRAFT_257985 [Phanerochaete carnosa HHB-10118-sp]EKM54259.1 hypothetical protein PHACADRAFT_257985 [Phanerochaete carnosa HHB-10118-sp]